MKTSAILREAARGVEGGRRGLFAATNYKSAEEGEKCEAAIMAVMPPPNGCPTWSFSPYNLKQSHRATILALAAAIAESEGD